MRKPMSLQLRSLCMGDPEILRVVGFFCIQEPTVRERKAFLDGKTIYISTLGFDNKKRDDDDGDYNASYYRIGEDSFTHTDGVMKEGVREIVIPNDTQLRVKMLIWARVELP